MIGVFVQLNLASHMARRRPIGYVIDGNGCWEWVGARSAGYGGIMVGGKRVGAHRYVYEQLVGQIPKGLSLDHLCRNHACVNPDHLEPVTHRVNVLRGIGEAAKNAAKTYCKRGHELERDRRGRRWCRTCHRDHQRASRLRKAGDR